VAGQTPNPTYEQVCSGRTGHTEAVLVVYDPGPSATRIF
jgi:peptide-methionine (S)-S-oxide reductase